ncbi:hypothetical protein GH714_003340 [Hevea brasiliensis]|uniref:Protein CHUP1, chloroplastic n=1 Tax=Hevea brasiliensis TaxID=3981 RepID=A0A6A6LUW8_HEVBR|nr:hypothetical protein GH714_003340 [Hevea brasiliensis]
MIKLNSTRKRLLKLTIMVAGKVRLAMGLQKSPGNPKTETPPKPPLPSPSSAKVAPQKVFSRSFGVYFPRSSAQVQPRPPDVAELLRLVEELRDRESRLKTELLEFKLLKESVAIVPALENEISTKNAELEKALKNIECLESENERLRTELSEAKISREKKPKLRDPGTLAAIKPAAPPPPPPPPKGTRMGPAKVRRVPEVVEFYHSLMRRDSRRESGAGAPDVLPATANARDMIGEIENRSRHLLAIKTDVETQGDFIRFLIKEVENAAFTDIEDVVPFVKWLDDELSYLVDERAVLKHFDWPEQKADALREAAFGYCDLKKLESEASSFRDDARHSCGSALKKMQALLEKLEHGAYNLSRMRESATNRYKGFQIPMSWMLETGIVSQFAGGFDVETMRAFQELRDKARSCHAQSQSQQQQKLVCSRPC